MVEADQAADDGAGAEAVTDDDDGLVRVAEDDLVQGQAGAGLKGAHGLSAGQSDIGGLVEPLLEQVGPAGEHVLQGLRLQVRPG
ncbi:MAG: hypothetical protein MZV65_38260 [Chromatiales bacterium]|nr:hypothetical protein [Chromatiales bacterium]